jgi:putative transposase
VSKQTITVITNRVVKGMAEWQSHPLDTVYAVIFIDAVNVKVREGRVANRPVCLALGVTVDGERDVLGLWVGEEGAKYWLRVLSEVKNRGVRDVCMLGMRPTEGPPLTGGTPRSTPSTSPLSSGTQVGVGIVCLVPPLATMEGLSW